MNNSFKQFLVDRGTEENQTIELMKMSKKDNPAIYVLRADCQNTHEKINRALWGLDGREGIVKDIADIKSDIRIIKTAMKHRWTAKDVATLIMAVAALLAALYQYLA